MTICDIYVRFLFWELTRESITMNILFLRDQVSAAVTEGVIAAHTKSAEYMKEKMGNLTKGTFR